MHKFVAVGLASLVATSVMAACSAPSAVQSQFRYIHEQQWIVGSIGEDIGQIALFAARKTNADIDLSTVRLETTEQPEGTSYRYSLIWNKDKPEQGDLKLTDYVWNPSNFSPWVQQLSKDLGVKPGAKTNDDTAEVIKTLADFTPVWLCSIDNNISKTLSENPLDAVSNEKAAFLCGLYGLRENASCFTDTRPWINRMVAHLAIARAARGSEAPSAAGRLSEIMLLTLIGRQSDALVKIKEFQSEKPDATMQSWLRALQIRATHDSRIADLDHAKLIERLEYGRALSSDLSADAVTDYLQKSKVEQPSTDWVRIGMRGIESVESGHIYCENSVAAEIADAAHYLKIFKNIDAKGPQQVVQELSMRPTGCLVKEQDWCLKPISWGDLSDFHNRHLQDAVYQTYRFLVEYLGVPDQAKQFREQTAAALSKLPLYPLCQIDLQLQNKEDVDAALLSAAGQICNSAPESVNCDLWNIVGHHATPGQVPKKETWFSPNVPFGTAFDFDNRCKVGHWDVANLERLKEFNPYDGTINRLLVEKKFGREADGDKLAAAYGPLMDYDLHAMEWVGDWYWKRKEKDKYTVNLERICKFTPDQYYTLGQTYEDNDQPEKAVAAYENGVRLGRNEVLFSNACGFLVDYYFDQGKKDEALKLAKRAADVYSARGLETMAHLCERMGNLSEAESWYKKEIERYDSSEELDWFYVRNQEKFPGEYKKVADRIYPHGITKVDPSKLSAPPLFGVKIAEKSAKTDEAGMKVGDIIVAVNGYSVFNTNQYYFARDSVHGTKYEFAYWRKGSYKVATVDLPNRRLGGEIGNFGTSEDQSE